MNAGLWWGIGGALVLAVYLSHESPKPKPAPPAADSATYSTPPALSAAGSTFRGYDCTIDCSGHEAGYAWAEEKGIDDPDDCGGNSESFIEGCRAYAEEQSGGDEDEDEHADRDE